MVVEGTKIPMVIVEMKATRTLAGPGVYGIDAEAIVRDARTREVVYVYVNWYDGFKNYTVSRDSMWEYMTGGETSPEDAVEELFPDGENPYFIGNIVDGELPPWPEDTGDDRGEPDYLEHYEKLTDAKKSAYWHVFRVLNQMCKLMDGGAE